METPGEHLNCARGELKQEMKDKGLWKFEQTNFYLLFCDKVVDGALVDKNYNDVRPMKD